MTKHLHIGGLVAAGFDPTGLYLLTVSHDGRGVFSTETWKRVARDSALAYPTDGRAVGIGPIEGLTIPITEIDSDTGDLRFSSPDGINRFEYDSGTLTVTDERASLPGTRYRTVGSCQSDGGEVGDCTRNPNSTL